MNADELNPGMWPCDKVTSYHGDIMLQISAVFLSNFILEKLNTYSSVA